MPFGHVPGVAGYFVFWADYFKTSAEQWRNDAERLENEGEEDGHSGDESVDECDSESDDDDEVVAFADESDSEREVPVNTPGSTHTRAGRLSIPNSCYLHWLA